MIPSATEIFYFIEVVRSESLSKAAKNLGVSQPAITMAIQKMEEQFGLPLLNRSRKGVSLTHAGRKFFSQSRQLLQEWQKISESILGSERELIGHFNIAYDPNLGFETIAELLSNLKKEASELKIRLFEDATIDIITGIEQYKYDFGIVVSATKTERVFLKTLTKDELSFWWGGEKTTAQNVLSGEGVFICDPQISGSASVMRQMQKRKMKYREVIEVDGYRAVSLLVSEGLGYGLLPQRFVDAYRDLKLQQVRWETPKINENISLAYLADDMKAASCRHIIKFFSDFFQPDRSRADAL